MRRLAPPPACHRLYPAIPTLQPQRGGPLPPRPSPWPEALGGEPQLGGLPGCQQRERKNGRKNQKRHRRSQGPTWEVCQDAGQ